MIFQINIFLYLFFLAAYFLLVIFNGKRLFLLLKKAPIWLFLLNGALLVYKLFVVPRLYSGRGDFGVFFLGSIRDNDLLLNTGLPLRPVYYFFVKIFDILFNAANFDTMVNFNILLTFISIFAVFFIVKTLFKEEKIAIAATLFYAFSPISLVISLTEEFTTLAIFFCIQAIFFALFYVVERRYSLLCLAALSSFLAMGSRPEYIIFSFIFLLFLYLFVKNHCSNYFKFMVGYLLLVLPLSIAATSQFIDTLKVDDALHITLPRPDHMLGDTIASHWKFFVANLPANIHSLFNLNTLMGVFIFLSLVFIFFCGRKYKKEIFFFSFYFVFVLLYYTFLHPDGIYNSCLYISWLIFPLAILAGGGLSLVRWRPIIIFLLMLFVSFSLLYTYPTLVFAQKESLFGRHYSSPDTQKEYLLFKESKNLDLQKNHLFIVNGWRSYLYSELPIKERSLSLAFSFDSEEEMTRIIKEADPGTTFYVYQGFWVGPMSRGSERTINPVRFEIIANALLKKEKEFFSFDRADGFPGKIFFYQMIKEQI